MPEKFHKPNEDPQCSGHNHGGGSVQVDLQACERASAIFRALGDPQRLRMLILLEECRTMCFGNLHNARRANASDFTTVETAEE